MNVVILAGGTGTRLWPLSREHNPKQFIKLPQLNNESLFQLTFKRALEVTSLSNILVVTNENQKFLVMGAIEELNISNFSEENIIVEPSPKNTLPAITLGMLFSKEDSLILSSDHFIPENYDLIESLEKAKELAKNSLVTFGIKPRYPHTGYGYIKNNGDVVEKFIEKPNLEKAKEYLKESYLWNSGMFFFNRKFFLEQLEKFQPDIFNLKDDLLNNFDKIKEESIDFGLLEKSNHISVIELNLKWSDLGSFDSIYDEFEKDENNNLKTNNVILQDAKNNYIHSNQENKIVTVNGLNNVIVIDTDDALLITPRESSQNVKEIVKHLNDKNDQRTKFHSTVYRPWGSYTILEDAPTHKVKRLTVLPGKILSLQSHNYRAEHWTVVRGEAYVVNGDEEITLKVNESTYIPIGNKHRLGNKSKEILEVIETQSGSYFGEDDIIRYEDKYNRK